MKKVAVITGATSGIGLATAELFRSRGFTVYGISRRGGEGCIAADITDEAAVLKAFADIYAAEGRIDLLVNNAGIGISGAAEETALSNAQHIFDVNFFGALRCIKGCLPYMRRAGGGKIINISSVAAPIAIPYQSFYSATKAAINSLTLALRAELADFNIKICAVMPGDVRTGFTDARRKNAPGGIYKNAEHAVAAMEKDERGGMPPEAVARVIFRAYSKKSPRPFFVAGGKYRVFTAIAKLLPARACSYIVGRLYR